MEAAYQRDSQLHRMETQILSCEAAERNRFLVTLEDTIFYPEGGGQPSDRGLIGEAQVLDVRKQEGSIIHVVDRPLKVGPVNLILDRNRRFDHSQQHTAQHLLTRLASDHLGWTTVGFGIGETSSHIDFDISRPDLEKLRELECLAADVIRAARPVRIQWVSRKEMEDLPVRSRRLPEGLQGKIRLVEIEGIDLNTCGGTHVENTAELETICLVATEPMHGGTRVYWVAGARVRRRMAAREELLAEIRGHLSASDEELPSIIALKISQLKETRGKLRDLREDLAAHLSQQLMAEPGPVVAYRLDDAEMLPALASTLAGGPGSNVFLLLEDKGSFALALAGNMAMSAEVLGPIAADALGGKGGGRDRLFRGKTDHPERLNEAGRILSTFLQETTKSPA